MRKVSPTTGLLACGALLLGAAGAGAQDWPQWRGANRDAKVTGFKAPKTWPKELTKKWKITVGDGVATPALVGDRLYVFSREDGKEVTRCLNAATGKEVWKDEYEARGASGPAGRFPGPRSSPAVADGKVVTLGVQGTLSCLDAVGGKKVWRKEDPTGSRPRFFTSCSPLLVDGLCVVQLGGENSGAMVAFDLANGDEKWKWTGDGTAYASPVLANLAGTKAVVAETAQNIVAVGLKDGKLLWKTPFGSAQGGRGRGGRGRGMMRGYNACTPVVEGQTVIFSGAGRGTRAVKLEKKDDTFTGKELWSNRDVAVQFSTPVIAKGLVFGISDRDSLFCLNADSGKTDWTTSISGNRGYGSVVDLGTALMALTPRGQLIVFAPSGKEFKQLAKYRVADDGTYAYPVVSGNRVYVKDRDALTLWTIE